MRELIQITNIGFLLETIDIAFKYNKVFCKSFFKTDTIGLIPTGGYSGTDNYSNKTLMWLVYKELMDGKRQIIHGRNGRE